MSKFARPSAIACLGILLLTTLQASAQIVFEERPIPQSIPLSCYLQAAKTLKDERERGQLLVEAVKRQAAEGQPSSANKFFSQVLQVVNATKDTQVRDDFLIRVQEAYIELGQYAQARQLVSEARQPDTRAFMLVWLAYKYAESGKKTEALELISQALPPIRKSDFKGQLPLPIIQSYAMLGQFDQALKAAGMLLYPGSKAETLTDIADAYIKAGQQGQATQVLAQAIQIAKLIKPEPPAELGVVTADPEYPELPPIFSDKERLLIAIATSYERIGQPNPALTSIQAIADPDVLLWLVRSYAEAGLYQPALRITDTISNKAQKKYALVIVVNSYLKAGQAEQALKLAESVAEPYLRSAALATIAGKNIELGKRERALSLLAQAKPIADTIASVGNKSEILLELASHYAQLGEKERAASLVSQALRLDQLSRKPNPQFPIISIHDERRVKRLINGVDVYSKIGQYEKAMQVATTMDSEGRKSAWQAIAQAYIRNRQPEKALQTIKVFKTKFPQESFNDNSILRDIVIHYVENRQFDRALQVAKTIEWESDRQKWIALITCAKK